MMSENNYDAVLIRYGELSLKNNNRAEFEKTLASSIRARTGRYKSGVVERLEGAIRLSLTSESRTNAILDQLSRTPGIAWFAPCWTVDRDLDRVGEVILKQGKQRIDNSRTFAVNTQRSDKEFVHDTMEINRIAGGIVDRETDLGVDLDNPDWSINIHVLKNDIHLFFDRVEGMQGLPVGSAGRVICQLSGGIDSPVAGIEMMKRGCHVDFVHFYPYASPNQSLDTLMGKLARHLSRYSGRSRLYLLPYYPFELEAGNVPKEYEMVLFRRLALRATENIVEESDYDAIITGESVGQVASQTLSNIQSVSSINTSVPILRPLIGRNKNQIIEEAKNYGTFDICTSDYKDCCSIQSAHPKTTSDGPELESIEKKHDLDETVRETLEELTVIEFEHGERLSEPKTVA